MPNLFQHLTGQIARLTSVNQSSGLLKQVQHDSIFLPCAMPINETLANRGSRNHCR